MNILQFYIIFVDFCLYFTASIYRLTAKFLWIFCIFLNEEESYWYNSGRFGKPQKRATFLVFSIFRLFPFMVTWKFSHIQKKLVANCISVKTYSFGYFYNFCGPWEYITYSEHLPPTLVYHTSNLKQEKPTTWCVFIYIYCIYNFQRLWEFFRLPHQHNLI